MLNMHLFNILIIFEKPPSIPRANLLKKHFCFFPQRPISFMKRRHFQNICGITKRQVIKKNYNTLPLELIMGCNSQYKAMCEWQASLSGFDQKIPMSSFSSYYTWKCIFQEEGTLCLTWDSIHSFIVMCVKIVTEETKLQKKVSNSGCYSASLLFLTCFSFILLVPTDKLLCFLNPVIDKYQQQSRIFLKYQDTLPCRNLKSSGEK